MTLDNPSENLSPEKRLLRRTLGRLDIGIDRAVVLVERETGRLVFLGIAHQNDGAGKGHILARKILGEEPGSSCAPGHGCKAQEDRNRSDE
jgi:hypothetical protein